MIDMSLTCRQLSSNAHTQHAHTDPMLSTNPYVNGGERLGRERAKGWTTAEVVSNASH